MPMPIWFVERKHIASPAGPAIPVTQAMKRELALDVGLNTIAAAARCEVYVPSDDVLAVFERPETALAEV